MKQRFTLPHYKNLQLLLLAVSIGLLLICLLQPSVTVQRPVYNYVFVLDITQSMNAQDYHVPGMPSDRLSFVKKSLQRVISELPCNSTVSLGLFTTKNLFLLFEPLEICKHFDVIEASLTQIDWRMAWATDSFIARGLYTTLRDLAKVESQPRVVFFTDGHQTPNIQKTPPFLLEPGKVQGYIFGVGNLQPVPLPKYDSKGIQTGFWLKQDAERRSSSNIPAEPDTQRFFTSVKENQLQNLANITGLQYRHLQSPEQLNKLLQTPAMGQVKQLQSDIGWIFAALALVLFILPYLNSGFKNG